VDDLGRVIATRVRTVQKIVDDELPVVARLYLRWAEEKGHARFQQALSGED
jgi:hypothetical protein